MKRFELADENTNILLPHKCSKCDFILYDAYECKDNRCTIFCKDHLPENKKCEICDGEFLFNQNLTDNIKNRYPVKCLDCPSKMMLKDFDSHLKEGCKKECTQKCGQLFSSEEEMKKHIKEECFQTVTKCIACSYSSKRGEVNIHQEICEEMEKIKQFTLPLEKKVEEQEKKINLLIEEQNQKQLRKNENQDIEIKKQEEEIKDLRKNLQRQDEKIETQDKEILLLKEQNQKQSEEIKKQGEEISFLKKYVEKQKTKEELVKKHKEIKRNKREEEKLKRSINGYFFFFK